MSTHRSRIVGSTLAHLVREEFRRAGGRGRLRVSGFLPEEITELVLDLERDPVPGTKVVVLSDVGWEGLPDHVLLPAGQSGTLLRNDRGQSFLFIDHKDQSDEQSLSKFRRVEDRSLLGERSDRRKRLDLMVERAWEVAGFDGRGAGVPALLKTYLSELFEVLDEQTDVSLRVWAQLLERVTGPLRGGSAAIDQPTIERVLGSSLPEVDLFPDEGLYSCGKTVNQRSIRIRKNHWFVRLRDHRGKSVDQDDLVSRIESTKFVDVEQIPLGEEEAGRLRGTMKRIVLGTGGERPLGSVQYHYWDQLFLKTTKSLGLGAEIYEFLAANHEDRIPDYEALEVEAGLNDKDREAAQKFLQDETDDTALPLVELLTKTLRKKVERLARPQAPVVDRPLLHLLRELENIAGTRPDTDDPVSMKLMVEPDRDGNDESSLRLFAFLFGNSLRRLRADSDTNLRFSLEIEPSLLACVPLFEEDGRIEESTEHRDKEDLPDPEEGWAPLRLAVTENDGVVFRFEWRPLEHPGLVALLRIVHCWEVPAWRVDDFDFESWCKKSLGPKEILPGAHRIDAADGGVTADWLVARSEFLSATRGDGLDHARIDEYVAGWEERLIRLRNDHIPKGSPDPEIRNFLAVDTFRGPNEQWALLATHPLRLRWISHHLREVSELLERILMEPLGLNPVNDAFYYDSLDSLSPHQQPPLLCVDGDSLQIAVRELDWHEEFASVKDKTTNQYDWLSDLDDSSIAEIASVVGEYLDAYPHKTDGLSVLVLVRERGARFLEALIRCMTSKRKIPLVLDLCVVAPVSELASIEKVLDPLVPSEERAAREFPSISVRFVEWEDPSRAPKIDDVREAMDLAIVPNLFGTHTRAHDCSMPSQDEVGAFDPWTDQTTHFESGDQADGRSVRSLSWVLLPKRPDPLLEAWSTVSMRNFRSKAVGSADDLTDDSIDYLTLQVDFGPSNDLYEALHEKAHWVVTMDRFIGRDQIEGLESAPGIITVRSGLGKSDAYSMIVSSQTGRNFIIDRVIRRLRADLPGDLDDHIGAIAENLYERSRDLSPEVLLRALGLGRAAQEIVGLLVARQVADSRFPREDGPGFRAWISLDQNQHWFGKSCHRADILRLVAGVENGRLWVQPLVVESKFRDDPKIPHAEMQVSNSLELVQSALGTSADDEKQDNRFWRREILEVMEQSSKREGLRATHASFVWWGSDDVKEADYRLPKRYREDWLEGRFDLRPPEGLIVTIQPGHEEFPFEAEKSPTKGHHLVRLGRRQLGRVLEGLLQEGKTPCPLPVAKAGEPEIEETAEGADDSGDTEATNEALEEETVAEPSPETPNDVTDPGSVDTETTAPEPTPTRRGRLDMEKKYQRFLDAFAEFEVRVSRPTDDPYDEGPGFFVARVVPGSGVKAESVRKCVPELKLKLGLPEGLEIRSYIGDGAVVFEVPKLDEERYYVRAEDLWKRISWPDGTLYAPLGEDIRGNAVGIDFSSENTPHLLIAGITGSGKSVALEAILEGLCRHYAPSTVHLHLVDPKGNELQDFAGRPHVPREIGWSADDAKELLGEAVEEMNRRYQLFRTEGRIRNLVQYNAAVEKAEDRLPWWLVVLDEYADLTSDREDRKEIEQHLARLSQKARAAGIHLIVATQKPSAEVISTTVRSNLGAQLALRVRSASDSRIIMNGAGAETLAGRGDAFLRTSRETIRLQCAYLD